MKTIYLDYAATTPVDPEVMRAMKPYFSGEFANTMSLHPMGARASEAVETSREIVARAIGASPEEICFTGSATESNNTVIKNLLWGKKTKPHLIVSQIEHDCILNSAKFVSQQGVEVTYLPVDKDGLVNPDDLKRAIKQNTCLVSIIHGNNEVGTIQDLKILGEICREKGVWFHTDASQSFTKTKIDVEEMKVDLLTASSHKIYGPKGAAILYVRKGVGITPLLHGGGHENGLRSSTANVSAIVGMGKAIEISSKVYQVESLKVKTLRDRLMEGLLEIEGTQLNGSKDKRLYNNVNISFAGVEGEALMLELGMRGVMVSTGSACSSASLEPSHVLMALGRTAPEAHGSLRFSLGRWTTEAEIEKTIERVRKVVGKFRKISPFKI